MEAAKNAISDLMEISKEIFQRSKKINKDEKLTALECLTLAVEVQKSLAITKLSTGVDKLIEKIEEYDNN